MKPRKVKEDDAPRTIACPHKVSVHLLVQYYTKDKLRTRVQDDSVVLNMLL